MALDFSNTKSSNMVNTVFKKADSTEMDNKKRDIDVKLIDSNPDNEYIFGHDDIDYLAAEIGEDGFNGAIEVYAKSDGRYEICSGHRRYLAAVQQGMTKIPCIVSKDTDNVTKAKRLVMSNIQQRKMTPLKWARSLEYYDKKVLSVTKNYTGKKRDALAKAFNISGTTAHRYMAILKLIPEFQKLADVPHFPYFNLYELTNLSQEQQTEIYNRLMKMSDDGDLSKMSKAIIDQQVNLLKSELEESEKEKKYRDKQAEISKQMENMDENDKGDFQKSETGDDGNKNANSPTMHGKTDSDILSDLNESIAESDKEIITFEPLFVKKESDSDERRTNADASKDMDLLVTEDETANELNKQFKYFLDRIESLADEPKAFNNKELVSRWARSLEELRNELLKKIKN